MCLYSDYPTGDETVWIYHALLALHSGSAGPVPRLYSAVRDLLNARPASYWFLSHRLDNEVLSCVPAQPFRNPIEHYFRQFRDYRTVETSARELCLLDAGNQWLVSYEWDGEILAAFFHSTPEIVESVTGRRVPVPLVLDADPSMMAEVMSSCRFGGNLDELRKLDERYRFAEHEWYQVMSWVIAGVTSAAENEQAKVVVAAIRRILIDAGGP